ncbi:MAG: hypothetical protein QOD37_1273, partial [Gaiellales bacterium]|nr:hypothetical protein [Gaiellales bacterium]
MTSAGRADELGTIAAPWLAAGLAAPALVASGPLGMALVALGPLLLTLRTGRQGALAATVAVSGALLGAAWSAHGIEQRAAPPQAA